MTDARSGYSLVMTTAGSRDEAGRLARMLVDRRLAACVQLMPIDSLYRWQGKVEQAAEILLLVKTRAALVEAVTEAIRSAHSYETPEVISVPIEGGLADYLVWIDQSTELQT